MPDLAFSELAFLNPSRHESSGGKIKEDERRIKKAKTIMDTEAEITRYFIANKTKKQEHRGNAHDDEYLNKQHKSKFHHSSPIITDIPEKPFLGFGTRRTSSESPLMIVKELDATYVPTMPHRDTKFPIRSSSYLSWSQSGAPLSAVMSRATRNTKASDTDSQSKATEDLDTIHKNVSLGGPPMEATQAAAKSTPSEVGAVPTTVLYGQNGSSSQHATADQAGSHHAKEIQKAPLPQSLCPADHSRSNVSTAAIPMEPAAETSGSIVIEVGPEKRTIGPVTNTSAQTSTNQQAHDFMSKTINGLLQDDSAELSEAAARANDPGPPSIAGEVPSMTLGHFDQVRHTQSYTPPNGSDRSQVKTKDQSRIATHASGQDRRCISSIRSQHGNRFWETLPASKSDEPSNGKSLSCKPPTNGFLHPQVIHTSKPVVGVENLITGHSSLYECQQESLTLAAGHSNHSIFAKLNYDTEGIEHGLHHRSKDTDGIINVDRHADDEDHEYEPFKPRFDIINENVRARHQQDCFDIGNTDDQAARYHTFGAQPELLADRHFQIKDPLINCTGLNERFPPQTLEAAQRDGFHKIDGPQYSVHPYSAENSTNSSVTKTALPTCARGIHVHRVGEDSGVHLEGFWKPNKLY